MNLANYYRDIQSEAASVLDAVIQKKGLRYSKESSVGDTFRIENDHCEVELTSSEDYFEIFCRFSMKGLQPERVFDLDAFLVATLGVNHSAKQPNTRYDEGAFGIWLEYYRVILEGYFDGPLQGDCTWISVYDKWVNERRSVNEFLETLPWGDSRDEEILVKKAKNDDSWVEDGKRLYKEIHGKEMA